MSGWVSTITSKFGQRADTGESFGEPIAHVLTRAKECSLLSRAHIAHRFFLWREQYRSVGFLRFAVDESKVIAGPIWWGRQFQNCLHLEQLWTVNTSLHNVHWEATGGWTIEDEQCQKTDGGYEAVKFRFLLWTEPTFYLRRSRVQQHEAERTLARHPKSMRDSKMTNRSMEIRRSSARVTN